ncbi:aminoglycoside phosphotransferase family protein [Actinopolymorpha sp. B9G3]|uniref:phosphotransferase family protein n=1 Tax=Actinopolymorpha sp. B9G3 TaxID=3158970 RepID=UPI0032D8F807
MTVRLTEEAVGEHLRARGIAPAGAGLRVTTLAGGVSSATFLAVGGGQRYVVKQPLPFLSVADVWPARQERAGVEARAIGLLQTLTPGRLPRLLDYDPERFIIVLSAAPEGWSEWRTSLLGGTIAVPAAITLGHVLGTWHAATRGDADTLAAFADLTMFLELRGDPYHRTVAARCPDLAAAVTACLDELLTEQTCLVHGDFSPKNVLTGGDDLWVLDFEVAHAGNPVFDVAFLLHHLVMKAVHLATRAEGARERLTACAQGFLDSYAAAGGRAGAEESVVRHTGALLLARVHGKSPAAYLNAAEAAEVSRLGTRAVRGEVSRVRDLMNRNN